MYCTANKPVSLKEPKGVTLTVTQEMVDKGIPFLVPDNSFFTAYLATPERPTLPFVRWNGSESEAVGKIAQYIEEKKAARETVLGKKEAMLAAGGWDAVRAERIKVPELPDWAASGLIVPGTAKKYAAPSAEEAVNETRKRGPHKE